MNGKTRHTGTALGTLAVLSIVAIAGTGCADSDKASHSPGYSAMFGNFVEIGADWDPGPGNAEIAHVSFHLPVDAYVYVSSSGEVTFVSKEVSSSGAVNLVRAGPSSSASANLWIAMDDKSRVADWDTTRRFHDSGFSVSSMYKLKKGPHTAYLMGCPCGSSYNLGYMDASIVVIATQNGTIGKNSCFVP
jgi:hypothetical protein